MAKAPQKLNQEPEAVEYARSKAGLSKTQASEAVGKSLQLYCDIEAGRRNATPEVMLAMAKAFNCPLVVLERKRWAA